MKREEIVGYEIFVPTFYDSNKDGIGDLRGIINKLNYLYTLGINLIILSPIFCSPHNNGLDVTNFYILNPKLGNLTDLHELIKTAKKKQIKVILSINLNHTSIEHKWFQKAIAGDKKYQAFYILDSNKQINKNYNNNLSSFYLTPTWSYHKELNKYYLHSFDETTPILNWKNKELINEFKKIIAFWLNKGIFGFKFDTTKMPSDFDEIMDKLVNTIVEETNNKKENLFFIYEKISEHFKKNNLPSRLTNSPNLAFLKNKAINYKTNIRKPEPIINYRDFNYLLDTWYASTQKNEIWVVNKLSSYSEPRHLWKYRNNKYFQLSLISSALAYLLLRGTPILYYGEEIGLNSKYFNTLEAFQDKESQKLISLFKEDNLKDKKILRLTNYYSRESGWETFQWPHLKNQTSEQSNYSYSISQVYKDLIALRKEYKVFKYGTIKFKKIRSGIISYYRYDGLDSFLILANWTKNTYNIKLTERGKIIFNNYPSFNFKTLLPYQCILLRED